LEDLVQDLCFMFRSVKRQPAFYVLILLVFALGIGANSIIFSVVESVVLNPLPYPDPDRLVFPGRPIPACVAVRTLPSVRSRTDTAFRFRYTRTGVGLAIGLVVCLGTLGVQEEFLFQVAPIDPRTLASATLLIAATTLAASFFPARRAATVDPVQALKQE
jgi:ABC-type antimicrobial peptide transport system permease subunit